MFTRLSRLHPNLQILVVILGGVLLWADGFLHPPMPLPSTELSILYEWAFGWALHSPLLATLMAFVLTGITVIIWHLILVEEGLLPRNNLIPALLTMLLLTYCPEMMRLSPVLPANLLLILSIRQMMKLHHNEQVVQDIFTAGLLLSLASLFNPYHVFFIPLIWFALVLFRAGSFREWVLSLAGLLTPLIYLLFVVFWNNQLKEALAILQHFFYTFRLFKGFSMPPYFIWIILGLMCLLFFPSFFRFIGKMGEKLIAIRKSSTLLIWVFFLGAALLPVVQSDWMVEGSPLLLATALIISAYMISVRKKRIPEILLLLFTAAVITGKFLL